MGIFQDQSQNTNQPVDPNATAGFDASAQIAQQEQVAQEQVPTQQPEQPVAQAPVEPVQQKTEVKYPQGFDNFPLKEKILSLMVVNNASDAYPVVGHNLAMKISGHIESIDRVPELTAEAVYEVVAAMAKPEDKEIFDNDLEVDFAYAWQGYRFRINAFHQMGKPSLTIRYLRNDINSMESLGLPAIIKDLSELNSGIILVCGVTGSGKSTTLAAMVDNINENFSKHIITIEDPVEYTYDKKQSLIEQREVGTDTKSFASAMKSALRQNPNVLLLGEMRDLESIASAITIAESGHLVLATIHARNSVQCINKIIDAFPADQQEQIRVQLSEALAAIVTQKLVPGKDGKLKLVMEIMVNNSAISNMIRESQTHQIESVIQTSKGEGMQLLDEHILTRLQAGEITKENAITYANKPQDIINAIG